jgi:hypothetical protein
MTTLHARYNSIGFTGAHCEQTFVHLATDEGEIRAYLTQPKQHETLCSRAIGRDFQVTLGPKRKKGFVVEADLLDAVPA